MIDQTLPFSLLLGQTEVISNNVRVNSDLVLDQVRLSASAASFASAPSSDSPSRLTIDELSVLVVLSEPNLNAIVAANLKSDLLRNVNIALLSGKMRISGQFIKLITIPFTLEAIPRIENGIRIVPEFLGLNASVFSLPASAVEILEQNLRPMLTIDLTKLPVPAYLDAVVCEPGRLRAEGRARVRFPRNAAPSSAPSSPLEITANSVSAALPPAETL